MSVSLTFFAPGNPKGQPRPRAFSRGGSARVYDPGTAEGWKGSVAIGSQPFKPLAPLTGPIRVDLEFYFARPKRLCRKADHSGRIPHTGKPDLDNLAKAVLDALTQLGWWQDDAQVVAGLWAKFWVPMGAAPGALVTVIELGLTWLDTNPMSAAIIPKAQGAAR